MHEMSITQAMLEIVREQMAKNGIERLGRVRIQVGELTAVEPDSLRFCFEVCTQGTSLGGAVLEVEEIPLTGRCRDCGAEFEMDGPLALCSSCQGVAVEIIAGRELDIISIETHEEQRCTTSS